MKTMLIIIVLSKILLTTYTELLFNDAIVETYSLLLSSLLSLTYCSAISAHLLPTTK